MDMEMVPCSCLKKRETQVGSKVDSCNCKHSREAKEEEQSDYEFVFLGNMVDQLLTEVLIRLPNDCVCRYKAVSKSWCSLISSPYFVSRFNDHASRDPSTFTLVLQFSTSRGDLYNVMAISNHPVVSMSYKNQHVDLNFPQRLRDDHMNENVVDVDPKSEPIRVVYRYDHMKENVVDVYPMSEPIFVVSSCHDLLLCSHIDARFSVVNLMTQEQEMLPPVHRWTEDLDINSPLRKFFSHMKAALLCYGDGENAGCFGRFKVILIPVIRRDLFDHRFGYKTIPPEIYSSQFNIQIYCSESRHWTDVLVDWYRLSWNVYLAFTPILCHKGMLHWLNGTSLVSLDPDIKLCHSINLPEELSHQTHLEFGLCQGMFRVARHIQGEGNEHVLVVWELEDYHKGVWKLAHRVVLNHSFFKQVIGFFEILVFHPYNRDVVFLKDAQHLYQFNMRTGRFAARVSYNAFESPFPDLGIVVPPLLHPWSGVELRGLAGAMAP